MHPLTPRESQLFQRLRSWGWSAEQARIGIRAGFRCEYCGRDLLESVNSYYSWQRDHIVPKSAAGSGGLANRALACRTCNFNLKRRWDPRSAAGKNASRAELIKAVKRYVRAQRQRVQREQLVPLRRLLRRRQGAA